MDYLCLSSLYYSSLYYRGLLLRTSTVVERRTFPDTPLWVHVLGGPSTDGSPLESEQIFISIGLEILLK